MIIIGLKESDQASSYVNFLQILTFFCFWKEQVTKISEMLLLQFIKYCFLHVPDTV